MTTKQMSFADLEILQRLLPDTVLVKLNVLIDWETFSPLLKGGLTNVTGATAADKSYMIHLMMFSDPVGAMARLSDPALEVALRVRIDFVVFCGLDLDTDMPEHLAEMVQFTLASGLWQANVTHLAWSQVDLEKRGARQHHVPRAVLLSVRKNIF
jgi:hypothetical protein